MRLRCISSSIKQLRLLCWWNSLLLRLDGFAGCGQFLAFQKFVVKIYQFLQPLPFAQAFSTLFPLFWCAQAKSKASHPRIFRGLLLLSQLHSPAGPVFVVFWCRGVLWTVIFRTPRAIAVESPGLLQDSPPKVWWLQQEVLIDVWNADLVASHNGSQRHDTQLTVLSSFVRMTALGRQLWFAHATWWKRAAEPARVPEQQTSNMERSFKSSREKESWMIESAGGSFGGE